MTNANALTRVRRGLLVIGMLLVIAIVGHNVLHRTTWLESIFWAVITISTVGYSYETPSDIGPAEQLLAVSVIIFGTVAVAFTLGVFLQAVIEGQIEQAMGVRRMTRQIEKIEDHVIICGFGRVGQNLAARLAGQNTMFVVVEMNAEAIAEAVSRQYLVIEGDATDEDVLRSAGIERAKTVVVALQTDADNVFLTLTARNMNPNLRILARGEMAGTERKLRQAGANEVVLPAVIGAHRIADLIVRPHAADLLHRVGDVDGSFEAVLAEIEIPLGSSLAGRTIREAGTHEQHRLLIVSIRRADGKEIFNPHGDHKFEEGDTLIAKTEHIPALVERWMPFFEAIRWVGVASLEFKYDVRDDQYKLIEINPRPWAILKISVDCGVSVPMLYYDLAQGKHVPAQQTFEDDH